MIEPLRSTFVETIPKQNKYDVSVLPTMQETDSKLYHSYLQKSILQVSLYITYTMNGTLLDYELGIFPYVSVITNDNYTK